MQSLNRKRISNSSVVLQAMVCAAALVHLLPASAQGNSEAKSYGLSGSLGVGVVSTATYEGSPNRRTFGGPDLSVSYRTKNWGSVELGQSGLVWQALDVGDFKLGLAAAMDPGRKTKESSAADPTPGDKRLAGMGDVRASAEAGVLLGYGPLSLLARKSVGDRGHKGAQVDLRAEFPFALTDTVGLRFGASAIWADKHYMQTYFGVTPVQARASGYRAYTPKAGVRKFETNIGAEYTFAKNWKLQGAVVWSTLAGDAEDSPLVARKSSSTAAASIAYVF
jgi:MipA family protein